MYRIHRSRDDRTIESKARLEGPRLHKAITLFGVFVLWASIGASAFAIGFSVHEKRARPNLLHAEQSAISAARDNGKKHRRSTPNCISAPASTGSLVGILKVPALGLVAPVEEGTKDQELNVAVGHVATSVYPGQPGAAVLLAHDVSYFVHIGQLHPPDRLIFETPCTTSVFRVTGNRVVAEGSPIPGSKTPSLVLDTCYPENALFYTSTRLLVDATKTGTSPHPLSHPIEASTTKGHVQENSLEYSTPVPAALEAEGLTLQQNEVPMGTMSMATSPTPHWDESPGPLDLEAQSLSIYFGGIHALRQDQIAWWNALSKTHVAAPKELISAESVEDLSPLNVQIRSRHRIAVQVVFSVEVHINGGQAPGRYAEAVSLLVTKQSVRLQGWLFAPLT